ncbi:E3 ubiquitin-protein ligase MIB2-like [Dreissena polymorpha]|uniref:RING-type E3 ubiquitin transferase n=1 Tax=Dreissena polymorpha TaxID=45954 RepID=A0A9D4JQP1_DREPO|nr:E3 ubiquitin-protein ligase MIB2-like [Dreissena polymorpha]XP_052286001.1 E3 ubiquitin-protein ligase MIB2-like [Dreissena polymorpha]XP_052286002.1 E3 ubiquitin-protein ligase MIB2-like [Dreissena polymorpha]XP_052286003.1 E3 ubiquitin-protein ligase MIB2-like [Dreissena polymorpha]XP_052286004.1 E3 ubiquitin-protein ligase MIB2-like [Dreissena polymorpha]KAH3817338.1 hypothetical protein DPMN_118871 [Dreissena polymorpha]
MTLQVGIRVVRGPSWSPDFGDQDGGEGHVGTVVEICGVKEGDTYPQNCVIVQWDSGDRNVYRAGYENSYDLRVLDNASIGVKHDRTCSGCGVNGIFGMLWVCRKSPEVALCTDCYTRDKHDTKLDFIRYDTPDYDKGQTVPKREISKRLKAMGVFETAQVQRGPDWRWLDQDGGEGKPGQVIAIVNFSPDTDRDAAEVTWSNGYTNVYRLGYDGRQDVVAVKAASGGYYYKDHIPVLKMDQASQPKKASSEPHPAAVAPVAPVPRSQEPEPTLLGATGYTPPSSSKGSTGGYQPKTPTSQPKTSTSAENAMTAPSPSARFNVGEKVKITMDLDLLKEIETGKGAWNPRMAECIGRTGSVILVRNSDVTVDFDMAGKWAFDESVFTKVHTFTAGEKARVTNNLQNLKMLQNESCGWNEMMEKVVGQVGTVEEVDEDGDVVVAFDGDNTWTLNPEALTPCSDIDSETSLKQETGGDMSDLPEDQKMVVLMNSIAAGDTETVNSLITKNPHYILMEVKGQFPISVASAHGHIDVIRSLFTMGKDSLIEFEDAEKMTPLLHAIKGNKVDAVKFLVAEGANKSARNLNNQSGIHLAITTQNKLLLTTLIGLGFDINLKDMLGQTPLFDAILNGTAEVLTELLKQSHLNVDVVDNLSFTPFLTACKVGNLPAMRSILDRKRESLQQTHPDGGYSALHFAAMGGHMEAARLLVEECKADVNARASDRKTPVHVSSMSVKGDMVEYLAHNGADLTLVDNDQANCLHLCFRETKEEQADMKEDLLKLVTSLTQAGVPVDALDAEKKRPLDYVDDGVMNEFQDLLGGASSTAQRLTVDRSEEPKDTADKPSTLVTGQPDNTGTAINAGSGKADKVAVTESGKPDKADVGTTDQLQRSIHGGGGGSSISAAPQMCQDCEEDPIKFKFEPCGHLVCKDCVPKKKKKKCGVCSEIFQSVKSLS